MKNAETVALMKTQQQLIHERLGWKRVHSPTLITGTSRVCSRSRKRRKSWSKNSNTIVKQFSVWITSYSLSVKADTIDNLTIFGWCSSFKRAISRIAVLGIPSSREFKRIFFRATISPIYHGIGMQNEPVLVSLAWNTTPYVPDANASQAHPTFSNFVNLFVSLHNYKNEVRNTNIEKNVGSPVLHTLVDKDASVTKRFKTEMWELCCLYQEDRCHPWTITTSSRSSDRERRQ